MSSPYELQKLKAENEALTKRVAELEQLNAVYVADMEEMRGSLLALQSQLAWTPLAKGLPTDGEEETYEFTGWGHVNILTLNGEIWRDSDGEFLDEEDVTDNYKWFRRITLPEAT